MSALAHQLRVPDMEGHNLYLDRAGGSVLVKVHAVFLVPESDLHNADIPRVLVEVLSRHALHGRFITCSLTNLSSQPYVKSH